MSITGQTVPYRDQDVALTGLLYRDPELGHRPGILLIHGAGGLDEHPRGQARRYAELGYTVLACDLFGPGVTGDRDKTIACLTTLRDDPAMLVRRTQAGLAALADFTNPGSNPTGGPGPGSSAGPDPGPGRGRRLAAVGFCFGGMAALMLARSGEPLAGVVSMHGSLATTAPAQPGRVRAKVLACHGALDPHVPMADVTAFAEEMGHAGADWQVILYGGAQHGFTHEHAVPGAIPGVAYDAPADARSFEAARTFLAEAFAENQVGQ
ncbi:MAG TPA: dienelactone hydrolase family protein [Streptosporangiaceae bacterium]|jgi:dienelactone hydrolase